MARVVVYPADLDGCGLYRLWWVCEALSGAGHEVACYPPGHAKRIQASMKRWPDGSDHVHEVVDPHAEIAVFQRPLSRIMVEAMAELRRCGIKIVVELDDDFKAVSPRNIAFPAVHPAFSPDANWTWLDKAVRNADLVTVTTPSLARRYGRWAGACAILPNYVPERYLSTEGRPQAALTVGWPGAVATHPDDLPEAARGVADAMRGTGASFAVIGPGEGVARQMGIEVAATGWVSPADYPAEVARLDVGLAPLEDSTFNTGKSWLKPLEFAALGVPMVMSPRAEYEALAELGIGRLAQGRRQWKYHVAALLADRELRAAEAARHRALVAELGLTIEAQAHRWWEAWQAA